MLHRVRGLDAAALDDERGLGLYTSLGFGLVTTEDYYELPGTGGPADGAAGSRSVAGQ